MREAKRAEARAEWQRKVREAEEYVKAAEDNQGLVVADPEVEEELQRESAPSDRPSASLYPRDVTQDTVTVAADTTQQTGDNEPEIHTETATNLELESDNQDLKDADPELKGKLQRRRVLIKSQPSNNLAPRDVAQDILAVADTRQTGANNPSIIHAQPASHPTTASVASTRKVSSSQSLQPHTPQLQARTA